MTRATAKHPMSPRRGMALTLVCLGILVLTSCNASITFGEGETGSGTLVTEAYDVGDFDSISVGNAFDVLVTVGEERSVEVTVDDNLQDKLDIRVRNGELQVRLQNGFSLRRGTLEATITMPDLARLDASGATVVDVVGVDGPRLDVDVSGASDVTIDGRTQNLYIDASGASEVNLRLDDVADAVVDLSGASSVSMLSATAVRGDLSGASDLTVPSDTQLTVDTSGASTINRG